MPLTHIHDYMIIKQLGKGSFGRVYLVQSPKKKLYALKSIQVNEQTMKMAKQQAQLYVSLEHQNIVKAHEFFSYAQEEAIAIVFDYCSGGDLSRSIGKIDSNMSKKIIKQIAEGLVYLHDKKIIHRDIKPQNILMMDGVARIADLGISRLMNTSGASTKILTMMYGAPEVFHQEKYDLKADVWSLGILSLQLLLGKRVRSMIKGQLPPSCRQGFPSDTLLQEIKDEQLRQLVKKMLSKKSDERFSSQQIVDFLNGEKSELLPKIENTFEQNQIEEKPDLPKKMQHTPEQNKNEEKTNSSIKVEGTPNQIKNYENTSSSNKVEHTPEQQKNEKKPSVPNKVEDAPEQTKDNIEQKLNADIQQKQQKSQSKSQIYFSSKQSNEESRKSQPMKKEQLIPNDTLISKFSQQHKSDQIKLKKYNSVAANPNWNEPDKMAFVESVVLKKGSSIRFKIQSIGCGVFVGLGIRNLIAANSYQFKNGLEIGHGCFLVGHGSWSYSHSDKEHNCVKTDFKYGKGDVILMEANEDELCFRNEKKKRELKMKIRLTEEEWQQASFCVLLSGFGDSVSICNAKQDGSCSIQ